MSISLQIAVWPVPPPNKSSFFFNPPKTSLIGGTMRLTLLHMAVMSVTVFPTKPTIRGGEELDGPHTFCFCLFPSNLALGHRGLVGNKAEHRMGTVFRGFQMTVKRLWKIGGSLAVPRSVPPNRQLGPGQLRCQLLKAPQTLPGPVPSPCLGFTPSMDDSDFPVSLPVMTVALPGAQTRSPHSHRYFPQT